MDLSTLQRSIYDQQRTTWQPVEAAMLADYNDFNGRQDAVADAGATATQANANNYGMESRQLARFGPVSADAEKYRTRMSKLDGSKDVVTARGMARGAEEDRRIDTGMALTQLGGDTLSTGMSSLALADGMERERKAADAARRRSNRRGIGGMAGMAIGGTAGFFMGGPVGAMAGAQVGGAVGSGLA